MSGKQYDLSHWPKLPKVSCQCITYGRPELLNEAVESFIRQDYPGPKELIILNDCADVIVGPTQLPNVYVVNVPLRFRSIGEKRNASIALSSGEIMMPWDDDDIYLPWRISATLHYMANHHYFKSDGLWVLSNNQMKYKKTIAHGLAAYSKELFDQVGGYPHIHSGQDQKIENLFKQTGKTDVRPIPLEDASYIYRFGGTGSYHLSAYGFGKGLDESAKYVKAKIKRGTYQLKPHWNHDYMHLVEIGITRMQP